MLRFNKLKNERIYFLNCTQKIIYIICLILKQIWYKKKIMKIKIINVFNYIQTTKKN